jgi:hypothetical protein
MRRLKLTLVVLLFALLFIYAGVGTYFSAFGRLSSGFPGWYVAGNNRVLTTRFGPDNPASALQDGDEIVALNGQAFKNTSQYSQAFDQRQPGSFYTITINRDGQPREFTLQTIILPRSLFVLKVLTEARVLAFIWLLMGLSIFLLRPDNKQALLLAFIFGFGAAGGELSPNLVLSDLQAWLLILMVTVQAASLLSVPIIFHFFLIFPERSAMLRRFPRLEYLLYLPWLLVAVPYVSLRSFLWITAPARFLEISQEFPLLTQSANTLLLIYLIAALAALLINYRLANQSARRKIRVVVAGSLAGLLPFFSAKTIQFYWGELAINNLLTAAYIAAVLMLALLPLSFAYAIARHQVIPISLIIRRSVQYLLAKNALRLLLALPVIGIVLTVAAHPERPIAEVLFRNSVYFYLLLMAAVALGLVFRKHLTEWIDRKFFRESYSQERILRELVDEVKKADSMRDVSRLVCQKVEAALHPEHVYLFCREEERRDLSLGYSTGGSADGLRVPEEFELLRFMESEDRTQDFPFPDKNKLPQSEKDWLARLGTRLIVPMTGTDGRLGGLFLLAQKRSEIPYTARDRELLETLADEIAIVHENVRLKERVERDRRIKQEVLARIDGREFNLLKECPQCGACYDYATQICLKDQIELTPSLPVERTIESRYRLEQLIGKGGMGAVYEATDVRLNRSVAVKILKGSMFGDRTALRRFAHEAQTSARLSHPNIITVHDYGVLSTEGAFLVMELAGGETLRAKLKRERFLQPAMAAEVFNQILEGLKAAHAAGVVHRDLKPENVLISESEDGPLQVRILDFGLAKLTHAIVADSQSPTAAAPLTTPGMALGTFGYMSPEQLMGGEVDERTDLFSIGVMVVEALTGQRPFRGATYHELLTNVLNIAYHLPIDSPETAGLDQVLQRCLAKDRAARFSSATELQAQLIPALKECPSLAGHAAAALDADTFILNR